MTKRNHEQGVGGADRTKSSGSNLDQGTHGAGSKGATIPQKGGKIPFRSDGPSNVHSTGDNKTPYRPTTHKPSAVRQGGSVTGHDRVNPLAGKALSGKKFSEKSREEQVGFELARDRGKKQKLDGATYLPTPADQRKK